MSPLEQLDHYLSGSMAFGILFYISATILAWGAWTFIYFVSKDLSRKGFIRWGILFTMSIWMMYGVQRYHHPPLFQPQRLWVQPFTVPDSQEREADLARFAFEKAMMRLNDKVVGFQTKQCGEDLLLRLPPDAKAPLPKGAKLIGAAWSVTGHYERENDEVATLQVHVNKVNWTGEITTGFDFKLRNSDPAFLGILAAQTMVERSGLQTWEEGDFELFTPDVMQALCVNDTASEHTIREAALLRAIKEDSTRWMVWEALADMYFFWQWPNHNGEARSALQQTFRLNEKAPRANYISGLLLWREGGHREEAISGFRRAMKFGPRDSDPYLALSRLSDTELKQLKLGPRRDVLEFALSLRPSNPQARNVLYHYYRDRRLEKQIALEVVNRGLEINPNQPRLLMMQAVAAIKLQQNDLAEEALNTVLAQDSTNTTALYNLGIVYRAKGEEEKSIETFKKVVELNGPPDAHYYLGLYYMDHGDNEEAFRQFQWRWVKRTGEDDDWFAVASRERMRLIRTGKSLTGITLEDWEAPDADSADVAPDVFESSGEFQDEATFIKG